MSDMYLIQWKSKVNGRAGRGTKEFSRQEADQLVEELNREYPQILHEVVKVSPEPQATQSQVEDLAAERKEIQPAEPQPSATEEQQAEPPAEKPTPALSK